jgi:hypothetical protein
MVVARTLLEPQSAMWDWKSQPAEEGTASKE